MSIFLIQMIFIIVPNNAIIDQVTIVVSQPKLSLNAAMPYEEMALPPYVKAFNIPETDETRPMFL